MSDSNPSTGAARRRWADPRLWVGFAITAAALVFAFRGVDFPVLVAEMARVDLAWLLLPSAVGYVLCTWSRALRWRHLLRAFGEIETGTLFRATAVGYMANNLFPFRLGELARSWFLARETGMSGAAIFGSVIVERVIDAIGLLGLAAIVLGSQGAEASGLDGRQALVALSIVASVPLLGVIALRQAPDFFIGLVRWGLGWAPQGLTDRICGLLDQIAHGLRGMRNGKDLFWVLFHSVTFWVLINIIPYYAALRAFGIDLGGLWPDLQASWTLMVWVGAAVALPSAPGFAGTYHAACRAALVPLGVSEELALALGTLAHALFWVSLTALGLAVLRFRGTRLDEAMAGAEGGDDTAPAGGAPE
ncbi:MAG: flippase-like domain-containing protein [bacterium]|nr:flippase-like domain-containing protein [bacterium]